MGFINILSLLNSPPRCDPKTMRDWHGRALWMRIVYSVFLNAVRITNVSTDFTDYTD